MHGDIKAEETTYLRNLHAHDKIVVQYVPPVTFPFDEEVVSTHEVCDVVCDGGEVCVTHHHRLVVPVVEAVVLHVRDRQIPTQQHGCAVSASSEQQ